MVRPIEERWARGWIKGIARILATGPPEEAPEEFAREVAEIEKIALEKGAKVYDIAKRWRKRLLEVLRP
ncbi:MAG: hypothetical protein ACE5KE_00315 [Methanosarcinales archaeon]